MKIQKTKDGSHTLVSPKFGELYHSHNGSLQEALHIFIKNGLKNISSDTITVFEMGLGSGLNAILSYYYAKNKNKKIDYITIEAYPVTIETIKQLNYNNFIEEISFKEIFNKIHTVNWEQKIAISEFFNIHKINKKIEDLEIKKITKADIVFYDAFAPNTQANLWKKEVLTKMYQLLKPNAFLITYCAKGSFKRTLKEIGFEVLVLPGPLVKEK